MNNNKKYPLRLADTSSISFFVNMYRDFISNIQNRGYKNFTQIKSDLSTVRGMFKNKEFSVFTVSSSLGLPTSMLNDVYTVDGYDNRLIGKTLIRTGKTENIFDIDNEDMSLRYLHVSNLNLCYRLYMLDNTHSFQIIENLLSYFRYIVLIGIVIFNIYLYLGNPYQNLLYELLWSGISLIAIPFSKWLPKKILYYIVNRNISFLFTTHKSQTKINEIKKPE